MTPEPFHAVGQWYEDFSQTTDEELRDLEDVTSILVTHEMDAVEYLASAYAVVSDEGEIAVNAEGDQFCLTNTSIMMLRKGRVIFDDTYEKLVKAEDPYIQEFISGTEMETGDAEQGAIEWKEQGE